METNLEVPAEVAKDPTIGIHARNSPTISIIALAQPFVFQKVVNQADKLR
jgi:hypothetical protein